MAIPVANAGPIQNVTIGATVQLTGAASSDADSDAITAYIWTWISRPAGSTAAISGNIVNPTFVPDLIGAYQVRLVVTAGGENSAPAATTINVAEVNVAPVVDAGPNVSSGVTVGVPFELTGASATDADGDTLTLLWSILSGPVGHAATLTNETTITPTLTTDVAGIYNVLLTADDGTESISDNRLITAVAANTAPVVNAGANINNAVVDQIVNLSGTATDADGDTLTLLWAILSAPDGSAASLTDATTLTPSFTPDLAGIYNILLTANDGAGGISDNLLVTASAANEAPIADAGPNTTATVGVLKTLDGSASSDPNGDPITYLWTVIEIPAGSSVVVSGLDTVSPSFTPDVVGLYVFRLVVRDINAASSTPAGLIVNTSAVNTAPTANAGLAQTVYFGDTVTLDGTGSSDPEGDPLVYIWTQLTGTTVTLDLTDPSQPTFVAPSVEGDIDFRMFVRDTSAAASPPSATRVTVLRPNAVPVADAGADQTVAANATVTISGSASSDADGDPLTYNWAQVSGIEVDAESYNTSTFVFTAPSPSIESVLQFKLVVNDGFDSSNSDYINITVGAAASDTKPPRIRITGPSSITIKQGSPYIEQGATAFDDFDGFVSTTVTGTIDTSVIGTYSIGYNAVDAAGNEAATVVRTVTVAPASAFKTHSTGDFHSAGLVRDDAPVDVTPELALSHIDGELLRVEWAQINPARGIFDFSLIDEKVNEAIAYGKKISFAVLDALVAPQWVKDSCVSYDYLFRDLPEVTPLPWDRNYQLFKRELLEALGAVYDGNPAITCFYFSYSAMSNGIEFHWRVDEAEYTAAGYTYAKLLQAAKDVLDMHVEHFPTTPIAIEGHTVFESKDLFEDLYDYGNSLIGNRVGVALWWLASRIVLNTSGNDAETVIWPIAVRAKQQNNSFIIGQTIGNFTNSPDRFDSGAGWTTEEAFTNERAFFSGGNTDGVSIDNWELWTADVENPSIVALMAGEVVVSTATVTITGITNESQAIKMYNDATDAVIFNGNVTFSNNSASVQVSVAAGTVFTGRWLGDNPPTTGTGIYGVTA